MAGTTTIRIAEIVQETEDFKTFVFEEGHGLSYQAGQFLTLIYTSGESETRRSYSITSSPVLGEPLSIGVKRIPNGFFSRRLFDLARPGDTLVTTGASGLFRLPDDVSKYSRLLFFAAGSGITPIFSLIKTALHSTDLLIELAYSAPSAGAAPYHTELQAYADRFRGRFVLHTFFGRMFELVRARLNRDSFYKLVDGAPIGKELTLAYTCGPESYMRMVVYMLLEWGLPRDQIRREDFLPVTRKTPKADPPDTGTHQVTLTVNRNFYTFPVVYPETILQAARRAHISLSYSCETGRCGSCAMRCTSGSAWMSNNEVLTDADIRAGLVLTCVGHPLDGDLVLEG